MIKLMLYFLIAVFMVIFGLVFKYENLVYTEGDLENLHIQENNSNE